jgi:hypothetical protein
MTGYNLHVLYGSTISFINLNFQPILSGEFWDGIWLGSSDNAMEGHFVWKYSKIKMTYSNWLNGTPNNQHGNENCVQMLKDGLWNDLPCDEYQEVVCEKIVPCKSTNTTTTTTAPTTTTTTYNITTPTPTTTTTSITTVTTTTITTTMSTSTTTTTTPTTTTTASTITATTFPCKFSK